MGLGGLAQYEIVKKLLGFLKLVGYWFTDYFRREKLWQEKSKDAAEGSQKAIKKHDTNKILDYWKKGKR